MSETSLRSSNIFQKPCLRWQWTRLSRAGTNYKRALLILNTQNKKNWKVTSYERPSAAVPKNKFCQRHVVLGGASRHQTSFWSLHGLHRSLSSSVLCRPKSLHYPFMVCSSFPGLLVGYINPRFGSLLLPRHLIEERAFTKACLQRVYVCARLSPRDMSFKTDHRYTHNLSVLFESIKFDCQYGYGQRGQKNRIEGYMEILPRKIKRPIFTAHGIWNNSLVRLIHPYENQKQEVYGKEFLMLLLYTYF